MRTVLVIGGAGYVGAVLVPKLLRSGYRVKILDLYIYGDHALDEVRVHPNLEQIRGDIRNRALLVHRSSNVTVTGGAGFIGIGSHLVEFCLQMVSVAVLDNFSTGRRKFE